MSTRTRSGRRAGLLQLLTGSALALSVLGGTAGPAGADTAPAPGIPATVSADALPTWQLNGVVWSQVVVNDTVYATGSFTKSRPPGISAGGAGEITASNIFAYSLSTGARVATFNHSLNGQGRAITASPDGSRVFVGGDFTTVDGAAHSHIAAFIAATGKPDEGFTASVNGTVRALTAGASTLYLGGRYTSVNNTARISLAAVSSTSGALLAWKPLPNSGSVWSMVLAPGGSRVIVGGSFTQLNGSYAYGMGSVDAFTGASLPWAANTVIKDATSTGAITSLRTDGSKIYGSGYAFGTGSSFEGTFAADPTTGAIGVVNDCHGDTYDVVPVGGVLYSVSHAHDCSAIGAFGELTPRRILHALAQTTDARTTNRGPDTYGWNYNGLPASAVLQWYPQLTVGTFTGQTQAAWSVTAANGYVALGGEFPSVNGKAQQALVRFAVATSAPNKQGPSYSDTPPRSGTPRPIPPTTATSAGPGKITVGFGTAWDYDNLTLTYELIRDGLAVVTTRHIDTNFRMMPTQTYTDTGLTPGSSHSYQVRITDPFGNTLLSPKSAVVAAT